MTMDNGEGRPLDESEAGQEDPQNWYFDLPGGAWERQEEKNRNLRERVLGNLQEDSEKAKSDPFSTKKFELEPKSEPTFELRRPEPEEKKSRGLFGRGKRQEQRLPDAKTNSRDDRGSSDAFEMPAPEDDSDDWTTEPTLKLTPFPRREETPDQKWGESDGGWNLSALDDDAAMPLFEGRTDVDDSEEHVNEARGTFETNTYPEPQETFETPASFEAPSVFEVPPVFEAPSVFEVRSAFEVRAPAAAESADDDFLAGLRAWAETPGDDEVTAPESAFEAPGQAVEPAAFSWQSASVPETEPPRAPVWESPEAELESADAESLAADEDAFDFDIEEDSGARPETLQLRPRAHVESENKLDWNFGPAAWGEKEDVPAVDVVEEATRSLDEPAVTPQAQGTLESMRKWAERDRTAGRFTVRNDESDDTAEKEGPSGPAPIPLRPRHNDEANAPAAHVTPLPFADGDGNEPEPIRPLPLQLRPRTGPDSEHAGRDPVVAGSKWEEFFGIEQPGASDGEPNDEHEEPLGEGISAMQAWAQKRAEPNAPAKIPEEFLKPFDWELQEDSPEVSPAEIPAEFLKPFEWESESKAPGETEDSFATTWDAEGAEPEDADETPSFLLEFRARPEGSEKRAGPIATNDSAEDDDQLAGIFDQAASTLPAPGEKKKKGRFGGLFGRKTVSQELPPVAEQPATEWQLPGEDAADLRAVAFKEWEEDEGFKVAEPAPAASTDDRPDADDWASSFKAWAGSDDVPHETSANGAETDAGSPNASEFAADDGQADESAASFAALTDVEDDGGSAPAVTADAAIESNEPAAVALDAEDQGWDPEPFEFEPVAVVPTAAAEAVAEPVSQIMAEGAAPWSEADNDDDAPVEAVASVDVVSEPVADTTPWSEADSDDGAPVEATASVEAIAEPVAETTPWWEAASDDAPAVDAPVETVASVETVAEPVADATPWWEAASDDAPAVDAPVEATASVAEPVADATPWWEASDDAPVEAVASVETVAEPLADTTPWWEAAGDDAPAVDAPVEAVASVETVAEPVADTTPWWEAASEDVDTNESVEALASVGTVAEPVPDTADTTPWWEAAGDDAPAVDAPVEAVASVDTVTEPVADTTPWWEGASDDVATDASVEAVASVDAVFEPVAEANAWLEASSDDDAAEAPVEAVASVDAVAEPVAETTPWWEAASDDDSNAEAPVEAVASADAVFEPVAEANAWLGASSAEDVPDEARAFAIDELVNAMETGSRDFRAGAFGDRQFETPAPTANDDDDPWADFVEAATRDSAPEAAPAGQWPVASPPELTPAKPEELWGEIANTAEKSAASPDIDLAASLESQMAEATQPTYSWPSGQEEEWESAHPPQPATDLFADEEEDEDVVLAAFNRHAATPESPEVRRENDHVFAELLGDQAADIVAEASEEDVPEQSFLRMSGWAPQRNSQPLDGGWAPEKDVEHALEAMRVPAFGGNDGAGFAPPAWAVDEMGADEAPQLRSGHRTKTWIRELVETGLLALLVFLSVRASFQNFKVEGSSMFPTLEDGQFLIVNKLVYAEVDMDKLGSFVPFVEAGSDPQRNVFHGPDRGDIIVLKDPRNPETDLIKRVIGLPGESIEILDGKVYINDRLLEEPYIEAVWHDSKPKITIPPGEFFVMGDNRDNSLDSRSSQVGLVPEDLIIGKAMVSYWPRSKFGLAANEEGKLGDEKPVLTTQRIDED